MFVDANTPLKRDSPKASNQCGRLNDGCARVVDPGAMNGRSGAASDFGGIEPAENVDSHLFCNLNHALPGSKLCGAGGGPEPTAAAEIGVDLVSGTEAADFGNGIFRAAADAERAE